ncbi:hypothetical protein CEP54_004571 [Fusarium duplospermum]|uniref:Uncharacterized protein n=1 Tax=Fusarium duplospermum TaxID=1325734 RepID=A0A428QHD8_9HYPO|nr:hypothetical protein CEP54_004571 [Fusarium duplospermum]
MPSPDTLAPSSVAPSSVAVNYSSFHNHGAYVFPSSLIDLLLLLLLSSNFFFFFSPSSSPSSLLIMVYHREWHYDAQTGDIVESTCCPCLVYGRTNLRLKIASDMRDGRNMKAAADSFQESTPIFPLLSSACCAFAFCLPCKYQDPL